MSKRRSVKEIRAAHVSWRAFHCTPDNAEVFERQIEQMHVDIGILLRLQESPKAPRFLTLAELGHVQSLLCEDRESGCYSGPREQYYARTNRLIRYFGDQIKDIARVERGSETDTESGGIPERS